MFSEILYILTSILTPLAGTILTYLIKSRIDRRSESNENQEINTEVNKITRILDDGDANVLTLMVKNVAELREYYVINKQQARNSFSAALIISILGFMLFSSGIVLVYLNPTSASIVPYSTIGGIIVEVIAGLFFWLYSKAIKQINIFHTSLQSTEKFLTAIQLVDKISIDKRDETYQLIIDKIINSNFFSSVTSSEK